MREQASSLQYLYLILCTLVLAMMLIFVSISFGSNRVAEAWESSGGGNNGGGNNGGHNGDADHNNGGITQVTNAVGQESETGDVTLNFSATQSGNNSNQCVTPLQFGNTGSLQNGQAVLQSNSSSGNIELEGSTFAFNPTLNATCNQAVQQSATAFG